jgi:hypothetical protein
MADSTSSNGTTSINGSAPQSLHKATLSAVAEGAAVQGDAATNNNILGNAATNTSLNKKLHGYVPLLITSVRNLLYTKLQLFMCLCMYMYILSIV